MNEGMNGNGHGSTARDVSQGTPAVAPHEAWLQMLDRETEGRTPLDGAKDEGAMVRTKRNYTPKGETKQQVLAIMSERPELQRPADIARVLGKTDSAVQQAVSKLYKGGELQRVKQGHYKVKQQRKPESNGEHLVRSYRKAKDTQARLETALGAIYPNPVKLTSDVLQVIDDVREAISNAGQ